MFSKVVCFSDDLACVAPAATRVDREQKCNDDQSDTSFDLSMPCLNKRNYLSISVIRTGSHNWFPEAENKKSYSLYSTFLDFSGCRSNSGKTSSLEHVFSGKSTYPFEQLYVSTEKV